MTAPQYMIHRVHFPTHCTKLGAREGPEAGKGDRGGDGHSVIVQLSVTWQGNASFGGILFE